MNVQIERFSETLDQSDGSGLERRTKTLSLGFFAEIRRNGSVNDREAARLQISILRQDKSHRHRKTQDPLPDAYSGENLVNEMGGGKEPMSAH